MLANTELGSLKSSQVYSGVETLPSSVTVSFLLYVHYMPVQQLMVLEMPVTSRKKLVKDFLGGNEQGR